MELRHVEYVLSVIDHGSFTAGAEASGVTQPSLSEGIRRLETELGVRLFDRVGRTVMVTDAGRAFEGPARRLIRERALVFDAVGAVTGLDRGMLDLVAIADARGRSAGRARRPVPHRCTRASSCALPSRRTRPRSPTRWPTASGEVGLAELPAAPRRPGRDHARAPGDRRGVPARHEVARGRAAPRRTPRGHAAHRDAAGEVDARSPRPRTCLGFDRADHRGRDRRSAKRSRRSCSTARARRSCPGRWRRRSAAQGAVVARLIPALTRTVGLLHRAQPLTPSARAFVELARGRRYDSRSGTAARGGSRRTPS